MATMPPQQAAPEMAQEEAQEPAGYTVCIRVEGGQYSVGVERESAEEAAGEYGGFQPARDLKEALTMAMEIIKADGDDGQSAQQSFDEGYGGGEEPMM